MDESRSKQMDRMVRGPVWCPSGNYGQVPHVGGGALSPHPGGFQTEIQGCWPELPRSA